MASACFFVVIGANSIAVYMAAHLFDFRNIGNIFVKGWSTHHNIGVEGGLCGRDRGATL